MNKTQGIPEHLSAKEISERLGMTKKGIWKRATKGKWPFIETPNKKGGGQQKLYTLATLPEDVKYTIEKHLAGEIQATHERTLTAPVPVPQTTPAPSAITPAPPSPSAPLLPAVAPSSAPTGYASPGRTPQGNASIILKQSGRQSELPDQANETALLRFDLVQALMDAKTFAKDQGEKMVDTVTDFLTTYNRGSIFSPIHESLGPVSRSTLLRWQKELELANMDYRALAPQWGMHRIEASKLLELEKLYFETEILNVNRVKISTAIEFVKMRFRLEGMTSPSGPSAFRAYARKIEKRHNHIWTLLRKGEKALVDECLPYLMRDDSKLEVGDVLVADGHKCNFTAINPFTGKPERPLLIIFYDWKSRDICGADIAFTENVQVIHNALRNAIIRLGKIPKIVYIDNGKAFKARIFTKDFDLRTAKIQGMYARLGIKVIFAKPYNARSKIVERFFKDFDESFSRRQSSFVGRSIDDKPASLKRNEKFIASLNPRTIPEIPEVFAQIGLWHKTFYSDRKHPTIKNKTRGEVFEEGRGPGVDEAELRYLMMNAEVRKIYRNGIKMFGGFYWHENLYGFCDKVVVKYDLNDFSRMHVYLAATGEFLCTANRVEEVHPMAQHLGSPKDYTDFKRQVKKNASLKKRSRELGLDIKENLGSLDTFRPLLESGALENINSALPETIEDLQNEKPEGFMDLDIEDIRALSGSQEESTDTGESINEGSGNEEDGLVPFHRRPIDRYRYLMNLSRDLTQEEGDWMENKFYPTHSGQLVLDTEGRKVVNGKKIAVNE